MFTIMHRVAQIRLGKLTAFGRGKIGRIGPLHLTPDIAKHFSFGWDGKGRASNDVAGYMEYTVCVRTRAQACHRNRQIFVTPFGQFN